MNVQSLEVFFKVFAKLDYGEELFVFGNIPSLGSWKLENALSLSTSSQVYPWWKLKKKIYINSSLQNDIVYRYCVFLNGKFLRYEGDFLFKNLMNSRYNYQNYPPPTQPYSINLQCTSPINQSNSAPPPLISSQSLNSLPQINSSTSFSSNVPIIPLTSPYCLPSTSSSNLLNETKIENTYYYLHRLLVEKSNSYIEIISYFENMEKNSIEIKNQDIQEQFEFNNNYLNPRDGVIMISYFLPIILYKELIIIEKKETEEKNHSRTRNDENIDVNDNECNMIKKKNRVSFELNNNSNSSSFSTSNTSSFLNSYTSSTNSTINFSNLSRSQWRWRVKWDKEALLSLQLNAHVIFVGTIRYNNEEIPQEEEEEITNLLLELNCYPIFLNSSQHNQFFNQFCKQELWLVMHHMAEVYSTSYLNEKSKENNFICQDQEHTNTLSPDRDSFKTNTSSLSDKEASLWYNYSQVHKKIVDKILEIYQPNYLISIHGFHLFLLPLYLRRKLGNKARIGYFFHTPFPSSELWKKIKYNKELLNGLLYCNLINFHCYEYLKHFQSTCFRILGYSSRVNNSGRMTLEVDGREIILSCVHVGVDLPYLQKIFIGEDIINGNKRINEIPKSVSAPNMPNSSVSPSFLTSLLQWKNLFPHKVIISGIDRLERLKGIPLRLLALDQFLTENPQWIGLVVFPLIGISASERGKDYKQTLFDVRSTINSLNKKFSKIIKDKKKEEKLKNNENFIDEEIEEITFYFEELHEEDFNLTKRLPYFAASDILLMTAARDGLNRYPIEFTIARHMHGTLIEKNLIKYERNLGNEFPNQGLIILSEFISCARVMRGALSINPYREEEIKNALLLALTMNNNERIERYQNNLEFSLACTTSTWISYVLSDLKNTNKDNEDDFNESFNVGFGLNSKIMHLKQGFHYLDSQEIIKCYKNSKRRLILLDWGGTLVSNKQKNNKFYTFLNATRNLSVKDEGTSTTINNINEDFGSLTDNIDENIEDINKVKSIIELLCSDPKNLVFIVSGKEIQQVNDTFGMIRGLGLGAEHGYYHRWPRDDLFTEINLTRTRTRSRSQSSSFSCSTLPFTSTPNSSSTSTNNRSRSGSITLTNQYTRWQMIQDTLEDTTWRDSAKILMDIFTKRTHGTYIEEKGKALIWQFSDADREFGFLQSKELEDHLTTLFSLYPIEVIRGGGVSDGYIEVRPRGASKGLFFEHMFSCLNRNMNNYITSSNSFKKNTKNITTTSTNTSTGTSAAASLSPKTTKEESLLSNYNVDFILAIGDDTSDEPLFEKINQLYNESFIENKTKIFNVTVGKKPSLASSYLNDTNEVIELLETFTKTKERERKFMSSIDLVNNFSSNISNDLAFSSSASLYNKNFILNRDSVNYSRQIPNIHKASSVASINYSDPILSRGTTKTSNTIPQAQPINRAVSQAHLSMSHYLESINSNNNQDDDAGIFF